jgi:hypothetical protein
MLRACISRAEALMRRLYPLLRARRQLQSFRPKSRPVLVCLANANGMTMKISFQIHLLLFHPDTSRKNILYPRTSSQERAGNPGCTKGHGDTQAHVSYVCNFHSVGPYHRHIADTTKQSLCILQMLPRHRLGNFYSSIK